MRRTRRHALALILSGTLALGACAESPTVPGAPAGPGLLDALLGDGTVTVLARSVPLAEDEVVTRTLGVQGGTISLPAAGLTVVVPYGALTGPTTITVTAPAGDLMGYHFAPHGLVFRKPLHARQSLTGTELGLLRRLVGRPVAAYFQGQLLPRVHALELLRLDLWGLLGFATFDIPHFSGYVIATD